MAEETWFAQLYQGSYRRLVLTAYGMTGDLGTAEEITQEAFAIAYAKRVKVSRTDSPELPGEVEWTRGGYVAKRGQHGLAISADGVEWRDVEIG